MRHSERLGVLVRFSFVSASTAQQLIRLLHSYFDNIARLVQAGYVPSDIDILRSRVKTTGITEIKLDIHGTIYRMMDVGGQRSERKKWIKCFQDVQVLLFVLAISGELQAWTTNRGCRTDLPLRRIQPDALRR